VLNLDLPFHKAHTPGELIERIDGDVSTLANFFSQFTIKVAANGLLAPASWSSSTAGLAAGVGLTIYAPC